MTVSILILSAILFEILISSFDVNSLKLLLVFSTKLLSFGFISLMFKLGLMLRLLKSFETFFIKSEVDAVDLNWFSDGLISFAFIKVISKISPYSFSIDSKNLVFPTLFFPTIIFIFFIPSNLKPLSIGRFFFFISIVSMFMFPTATVVEPFSHFVATLSDNIRHDRLCRFVDR